MSFLSLYNSQVSKVTWHMGHYTAPTPKPHYAYSNSPAVHQLYKGPWKRKRETDEPSVQTCRVYEDSHGKKRYVGTSQLTKTECPGSLSLSLSLCYVLSVCVNCLDRLKVHSGSS